MMTFKLELKLGLTCPVCKAFMDEENARATIVKVALLGVAHNPEYKVCIGCFQEVDDKMMNDRHYRLRWRKKRDGRPI